MELHLETEINASADKVWDILAHQFADVENWASVVDASRAIDASEVPDDFKPAPSAPIPGRVTTTRLGTLKEILVTFSDDSREFIFQTADLPPIFTHAQNHSRVIEKGPNRSVLSFDVRMEPRGIFNVLNPLLKRRFAFTYGRVQEDLKLYAETGQVSEEKRKKLGK